MNLFPRRRSAVIKILVLVIVTWFLVTVLLAYNEKVNTGKDVEMRNIPNKNVIRDSTNKFKEVNQRESIDNQPFPPQPPGVRHKYHKAVDVPGDQGHGVLPPPGDPEGPGEMGKPVKLNNLTQSQQAMVKQGWEKNAFNQYISDLLSLHRNLPDVRDKECRDIKYMNNLPQASVIVCFHNEAWSVLLRTVHSILDRSPPELIKEVILVDDFSDQRKLAWF
ncbi:putative polypeptide N-acetylgalactosaminyltransferase 9 [Limulus polyphemus]|uniref:Polypeptide N-acetylgalactosaminyltransferase 9 n=1 Tax=Limulus polyphemus TaxID=6850 RepID=A0ABM1BLC1_LIMPO|nr:putative polypeptide N-acetylgalactosaminyltransferase 9 [Limulus polyphemus]XP_022252462.1 putative polypeptide N-acetylgalactosaminyltransferase 9 [Limulus polyphemus]XP_022252463.1 putative polypeptide N-acetylgalactosaminyltransferase 9 [Limulus polyphemus]